MSLIGALYTSFSGLQNTEARLNVTSNNVSNADKPGYTRKEYESEYYTSNLGTVPVGGSIESIALDPYLEKTVIEDTSAAAKSTVEAEYLNEYADRLGSTDGGNTLSASLDELSASLDQLSVTPEDGSLKSQVVNNADDLAFQLRELSDSAQDLRSRADREIDQTVDEINASLQKLEELNKEITLTSATGRSTANLEDERRLELEELAANINVEYFINGENQLNIYLGGQPLLTSSARTVEFTASTTVNGSVTYPGGLSGVTLNGNDITSSITGGELGGLLELRDVTLVEEQAKLDEFANVLSEELNTLLNQGASIPSRPEIIGDEEGFTAADPLGGTGFVRIAVTDESGVVISTNDFDLSAYATVGDLIADINATFGPDVTANLNANGALQLTSNNVGTGISINELDSSIGADGDGFSHHFGLNNLYTGNSAEDIQVSDYLQSNPEYLATGRLSDDPALANGDTGINIGDGSLSKEMNEAFTNSYSFASAGNFVSQSNTLDAYADKIMADIATRANNALEEAETTGLLLEQTRTTLLNLTGVNVDEEMTHLIDLEAKYEASATLIATIQEMFDQLIAAVR